MASETDSPVIISIIQYVPHAARANDPPLMKHITVESADAGYDMAKDSFLKVWPEKIYVVM